MLNFGALKLRLCLLSFVRLASRKDVVVIWGVLRYYGLIARDVVGLLHGLGDIIVRVAVGLDCSSSTRLFVATDLCHFVLILETQGIMSNFELLV